MLNKSGWLQRSLPREGSKSKSFVESARADSRAGMFESMGSGSRERLDGLTAQTYRRQRAGLIGLVALTLALVGHACASAESTGTRIADFGPQDAGQDTSLDRYSADSVLPDGTGGALAVGAAQLCGGEDAACNPEDRLACTDWAANAGGGGSAGVAGSVEASCQVRTEDGAPVTACRIAGNGLDGDPCVSPADCSPGLTCSGESGTSQCRWYCCSDPNLCPTGTFCAQRSLRDVSDTRSGSRVPVCIPPVPCVPDLDEPFPCDPAVEEFCSCPTGTACMVVRDGLTSCATPGIGREGESCPCSWGHVCSQGSNTCLKLCQTGDVLDAPCGEGECQGSSSLPDGFGVCIGGAP